MSLILDVWKEQIEKAVNTLTSENVNFSVNWNDHVKFGHASTNAPLLLAKHLKTSPESAGNLLIDSLKSISDFICNFTHPGFINVTFTPNELYSNFPNDNIQKSKRKVLVEYTDPNPFKPFHIGHLMANATGQFISNALEYLGDDVVRICYSGDVGRHIAMSLYGMRFILNTKPAQESTIREKVKWLGECYRYGYLAFDNENDKEEILNINKQVYSNTLNDQDEQNYIWGRGVSYNALDDMYKTLGTKFDSFILESETAPVGMNIIENNRGVFAESEGAIVFKGEDVGLHTRVFINSLGLPTYEAKDLGNMKIKLDKFSPFEESIVVTANEQAEYFKVVNHVINKIWQSNNFKTTHYSHGIMRFKNGKMSSRKGTVIEAMDLIEETIDFLNETFIDKKISKDVLEKIAIGAIKFAILKQSIGSDIVYDFEKVISIEGDSAPYIMYTYSRTLKVSAEGNYVPEDTDTEMLISLSKLKQSISIGTKNLQPQTIIQGLLNLSHSINSYYTVYRIKGDKNKEALLNICANEIKRAMDILGLPLVKEM